MPAFRELRFAFRTFRRAPGYAWTVVLTLAVAIGANAAIFSVVHAVLLRPLPVASPGELAVVWQTDEGGQAVVELTYRHMREWLEQGAAFTQAAVVGSHNWNAVLEGRGDPSRIWFAGVSAGFFETLGVQPLLGRGLRPDDDVPNGPGVAVLNYDTWVRRFGADPHVVGTSMTLDGEPIEIVGVMPQGLDIPRGAEFWVPVVPVLATGTPPSTNLLDGLGVFYVLGRMKPGLDASAARAEIDAAEARLDAAIAGRPKWGSRAVAQTLPEYVYGPVRPALFALWAAVVVLLLVGCANVSGLMLTRVSARRREHAIRLALGSSRGAVARLWLVESLAVAALGGGLGLALGAWLARLIVALAPDDVPHLADVTLDPLVAAFTLAIAVAAALLSGVMPARHAADSRCGDALQGERTTSSRRTLHARSALLVAQIGLSVVLLVATGLVVRSFFALRHIDLGFVPDRVITATVQPRGATEPPNVWLDRYLTRVRALPGVEAAGAVYLRPLMLGPIGQGVRVTLEGQPNTTETRDANPTLNHQIATPGYFEAMRIALRRGRLFDDRDVAGMPRVAIVGRSTAARLWPGQDPIGKRLLMATFTPGGPAQDWRTVVGVVDDVRYRGLDEVQLDIYDPALQVGRPADTVVVRTSGSTLATAAALRDLARALDSTALVDAVTTMDAVVARAMAPWRLMMWMFLLFGGFAFALTAIGLFGLVALDVAQRRRELAIRLTLGATRASLVRAVVGRAAWRVAAGVLAGVLVARLVTRALQSVLFDVAPGDPATYAAVLVTVVCAVTVAALVPALGAGRVDPQRLLRDE